MNNDCFPNWLKRRNVSRYGPQIEDSVPYPVYQVQPAAISADNPNFTSIGANDSFFNPYAGVIATANIGTTVYQIMPANLYDTIDIVAEDLSHALYIPIFLGFDRPGRLTTFVQDGQEVNIYAANAVDTTIAGFDRSSMFNYLSVGTPQTPWYSCLHYDTLRTNRTFYVWFGQEIATGGNFDPAPAVGAAFKIAWQTKGR